MGRKSVYPPPSTVYWLRDYFQEVGVASPYRFYKYMLSRGRSYREEAKRYKEAVMRAITPEERARALIGFRIAIREAKRWEAVTYDSIRRVFYMLRRLDLIEFVRSEAPARGGHPRRYYRIKPGRKGWFQTGLQRVLWVQSYWGKAHYKWAKRLKRIPPAKKWPPE